MEGFFFLPRIFIDVAVERRRAILIPMTPLNYYVTAYVMFFLPFLNTPSIPPLANIRSEVPEECSTIKITF